YLGPPGFNQIQNRSNPNQNYQNRNQENHHGNVQGNNQERNQFFQGASHGQNPPPAYQAPDYQAPGYQAPVHQAPIPQPQVMTTTENIFLPLDNPELTIRRRSCANPTLLNDFEMVAEGNGNPPFSDLRSMEELCQPSLNGRGGPIAPIAKNDMIQQYNLIVYFWCTGTRSSARNIFLPLDNPELTIRRRSCADPTLLNDFEMVVEGNGNPPVSDLRSMEELCQPSLNGRGGPIAPISIQATNFGLKNDMIQQVQNSCQFHGLSNDDANKHLDKFLHVT
nr:reverse transcriptase domain-containing protein [Tanacetum cinerariifolium]